MKTRNYSSGNKITLFKNGEIASSFTTKNFNISSEERKELIRYMKEMNFDGWLYESIYNKFTKMYGFCNPSKIDDLY